eukprot:EG_transcript_36261
MLLPARLLHGLLPAALLEEYDFWQNEDGTLCGYQQAESHDRTKIPSMIRVQLVPIGDPDPSGFGFSEASAVVQRVPLRYGPGPGPAGPASAPIDADVLPSRGEVDPTKPSLTLLNLLCAPDGTYLKSLAQLLLRLDNLSHCLVWTRTPGGGEGGA